MYSREDNMNTKLILAIVLVALIGVVAGTYQVTNNADTTNTFTAVETEDVDNSEIDSTSNVEANGATGGDSVNVNHATSSKNVPTSSKNARSNSIASISNANGGASNSNNGANQQANNNNNPSSSGNSSSTVTESQLLQKAITQSKSLDGDGAHLVYDGTANGIKYYTYALTKDGSVIGEAEYDQYGKLTGGAFKGEVKPSNNTTSD